MRRRCNDKSSKYYGAVGVTYCDRWELFRNFVDDMGVRPAGTTLERKDGTQGYTKENCIWATPKVQANNRRNNIVVEHEGVNKTLAQLSEDTGVNYYTLHYRHTHGNALLVGA